MTIEQATIAKTKMDERTKKVVEAAGMENLLTKFVNLPSTRQSAAAAEDFKRQYCDLFPGMPVEDYRKYVDTFRYAWRARSLKAKRRVEPLLENILSRSGDLALYEEARWKRILSGEPLYGLQVDFVSGRVRIRPDSLLDHLVSALLKFRKMLAVCESKDCSHPYFVRSHGRQRYCSHDCAAEIRSQKKDKWWDENRERFIRKWRRQRRLGKQNSKGKRIPRKEK